MNKNTKKKLSISHIKFWKSIKGSKLKKKLLLLKKGIERKPLHKGLRFGRLVIIKFHHTKPYSKTCKFLHYYYLCKCDCGKMHITNKNSLISKTTKSCGCLAKEINFNRYKETTAIKRIFKQYKYNSIKRKIPFKLSFKFFSTLLKQQCYYCGCIPSQKLKETPYHTFLYNGIDRIDNKIGYIKHNVITCCGKCNFMKHELSQSEFYKHIKEIYNYVKNRI